MRLVFFVALAAWLAGPAAQAGGLKLLHRFVPASPRSHQYGNGANPGAELIQGTDGNFYGVTERGGTGACPVQLGSAESVGCGSIFRLSPTGQFAMLFAFPYDNVSHMAPQGNFPMAALVQGADGFLYGSTSQGGDYDNGTIFRISRTGAFTTLHHFCGQSCTGGVMDGAQPLGHLVQSANGTFYGTTQLGGAANHGVIFAMQPDGNSIILHHFHAGVASDGADPIAGLTFNKAGTALYGSTVFGGKYGGGTVFCLGANGSFTILHHFPAFTPGAATNNTAEPNAALLLASDGRLYGTTYGGPTGTGGSIFTLDPATKLFRILHEFAADAAGYAGFSAHSPLMQASDGNLYGTTYFGPAMGQNPGDGTLYMLHAKTGRIEQRAEFTAALSGSHPSAAPMQGRDHALYLTAYSGGGSFGNGTVVKFNIENTAGQHR